MGRVLVACEFSGRVRDAFRALGHDAWSCDLLPCEGDPRWHIQGDALEAAYGQPWDMMIAHPPCTFLTNAGARWLFEKPGRWQQLDEAAAFFNAFDLAPIDRIAKENPWPHKWAAERIGWPNAKMQPYEHGERQKKGICWWLKNLPPLLPSVMVGPPPDPGTEEAKAWEAVWREPPGPNQAKNRSRTLPGVAAAIATQWGSLLENLVSQESKP